MALLFLDGQLGPASFTLRRAAALTVLAVVGAVRIRGLPQWLVAAAAVAALALLPRAPSAPLALVALVIALAAITPAAGWRPGAVPIANGLVAACLSYVLLRFATDLVPQAGAMPAAAGRLGSLYIDGAGRVDAKLSFTALGGPAVSLATLYLLWSWRRAGGPRRLAAAVAIPIGWFALLPVEASDLGAGPLAAFWRGAWYGMAWLGIATFVAVAAASSAQRASQRNGTSNAAGRAPLVAAFAAAAFAGVCLVGTGCIEPRAARTIRVHNRGGLDWERPAFGRFGAFSGGMFGTWPVYCRAEGYDFGVIDESTVEAVDLRGVQTLVLINSPKIWDQRQRRTIYDFVARGGSLLVLGDHTDVFGLMRGFNSLLSPLGIRFRFDSAYKARETWRGCQAAAPDAVCWGWDDENPGVAVGASLESSGSARPLLVGRYAFSDSGVRENAVGSFLGNYHYDRGERLGDLVLAATATYGRGRVVVWGDTSAFQGVSTDYPRAVGPMLAWLSRPAAWTERPLVRLAAAIALVSAILWLWQAGATVAQTTSIAVGLLVGLTVPWVLSAPRLAAQFHIAGDTILIDKSHFPASGHYDARVNPVGPLYTNLLRSGFRVAELEDWDSAAVAKARGIAFVAPQRSFAAGEVADLLNAEARGAVVILTVGQPDSAGSRRLLDAHGLALLPRPMGTVSPVSPTASRRERESQPRFLDAWPIVAADGRDLADIPGVEIIYRHGDDVIALFHRVGRGGLLLISDTRFFSDMNVEGVSGYWLGNLALIQDLFQRYLGANPDAVRPLFRSPEKPQ